MFLLGQVFLLNDTNDTQNLWLRSLCPLLNINGKPNTTKHWPTPNKTNTRHKRSIMQEPNAIDVFLLVHPASELLALILLYTEVSLSTKPQSSTRHPSSRFPTNVGTSINSNNSKHWNIPVTCPFRQQWCSSKLVSSDICPSSSSTP